MARRTDTSAEASSPPTDACPLCLAPEPDTRYHHFLDLARDLSFEHIELHLWAAMRNGTRLDPERIKGYVEDWMTWIKDQVQAYSHRVNEYGVPLPWWEARRQVILAMRASTEQKRRQAEATRQHAVTDVADFSRIPDKLGTPLQEPTTREAALWEEDMAMAPAMTTEDDYTDVPEED